MILEFENMNLAEIGDIHEAVDKFSNIIEAAAKKSLQPVTEKKESSSTSTVASLILQRLQKYTETFKVLYRTESKRILITRRRDWNI